MAKPLYAMTLRERQLAVMDLKRAARQEFLWDFLANWSKDSVPLTPCKTRTFSVVVTGQRHGAVKLTQRFPNRPTVKLRRLHGAPGYYTGWDDKSAKRDV